ncbi:MAG TPA: Gfo/Idh/MocA family oxidoreductase, partial [Candidatus Saccharimonadales bacterium]|nr:Gfo/Idh/MocA family oxidoreductase [Candidatus Saccharimonadales bacterium]
MTVRVGFIGSGFMGRTWVEVAANHVAETRVVAVSGGSRAASLAWDYGAAAEPSPEALVARYDIDLVIVATPQPNHWDGVVLAARAGKHVLVEKPMARDRPEADAMVIAAEAAKIKLAVVSQHRFRASPVFAQKLIQDGAIGRLLMVRAQGVTPWDEGVPVENEPFADMGFHVLDLLRGMVGSPVTVGFGRQASFKATPPPRQST